MMASSNTRLEIKEPLDDDDTSMLEVKGPLDDTSMAALTDPYQVEEIILNDSMRSLSARVLTGNILYIGG